MPRRADAAALSKKDRDVEILTRFIGVYCRHHHGTKDALCGECADLLRYAAKMRAHCPLTPKPKCKDCAVHCYKPAYRARIREVMRYSGIHHVKRGRVDWLVRYFL